MMILQILSLALVICILGLVILSSRPIKIKVKLVNPNIITELPKFTNKYAAGADIIITGIHSDDADFNIDDLHYGSKILIAPGQCIRFLTNLSMEIPKGYYLDICPRSGIGIKRGLVPSNTPARIDSDYRGEIIIGLRNISNTMQEVEIGERIAQVTLHRIIPTSFVSAEELSKTKRNTGGLGSTGRK